jgi:hypothetical protein
MSIWLWVVLVSNLVYWSIFVYLLTRRWWDGPALIVGVLHMLFASFLVAAPIRSFLDPSYIGYQIGMVRIEGQWATLPSTLFLAWALSSAWIAVSRGRGSWMKLIAVGDILFALNLGGGFVFDLVSGELATTKIQGGEFFTLQGTFAALLLLVVFALPFVVSAAWAVRRSQSGGPTPPLAEGKQGLDASSDQNTKGINGFQLSEHRV